MGYCYRLVGLVTFLAVLLVFDGMNAHAEPKESKDLSIVGILAGSGDSTFTRMTDDLNRLFDIYEESEEFRVLPSLGKGALKNIKDLLELGRIDLAFTQMDVLEHAAVTNSYPTLEEDIRYIGRLHNQEVHLLARIGISDFDDLEHQTINAGPNLGGSYLITATLLDEFDVIDAKIVTYPHKKALQLLINGEIDAMVLVDGKPNDVVAAASLDQALHLINIPKEGLSNSYDAAKLSSEDYPSLFASGDSVNTIAIPAVLAAYAWLGNHPRREALDKFIAAFVELLRKRLTRAALDGSEFIGPVSSSTAPGRRAG